MSKNNSKEVLPEGDRAVMIPTPIRSDFLPQILYVKNVSAFVQFAKWYATPGQFREPENQKEFARSVGVCEDTLTDWKRHPQFWPIVQIAMSEWMKEHIPDVMGGLYLKTQGEKCSAKDVEMFLRIGGIKI